LSIKNSPIFNAFHPWWAISIESAGLLIDTLAFDTSKSNGTIGISPGKKIGFIVENNFKDVR
jgi:hypothetical protein